MKHSNTIGALASLALIISCFIPWVTIEAIQTTITGVYSGATNFGKPGYIHIFFSLSAIVCFLIPAIWAKRSGIIICTLNFAWAIKNYFLISRCEAGECPIKHAGIYLIVLFSFLMLVTSLLPKIQLPRLLH